MKIQAAAYGYGGLIFLADSVSDADVTGLLVHLSESGIAHIAKRDNGIDREIDLTHQEGYAGNLFIASQDSGSRIRSATKLTLMPYLGRLREPKLITGEIKGEIPIREILRQYDFLVIEAIDENSMKDYNRRFSDLEGPLVRVQPHQDQERSIAIGHSWPGLLD